MTLRTPEPVLDEEERRTRLGDVLARPDERARAPEPDTPLEEEAPAGEEAPVQVGLTSVAAALSTAAASSVAAGLFVGTLPRLLAAGGAALGAALVWLSYRARRTTLVQFLIAPAAVGVAALVALADAGGNGLPALILDAVRSGGIGQPPVAFDPGWRFLLVLLSIALGGAAAGLACGVNRPKLAVFLPLPVLFGALLAQSTQTEVWPVLVAFVLLVGSFAVSFGVDLAREGATSGGFELRRLAKGAGTLVALVALLAVVAQAGFLFPEPRDRAVIPPRRPEPAPPQRDRELFTVRAPMQVPWRLGVLDVYDGRGWLTPPLDPARPVPLAGDGAVPGATARGEQIEATFTIADVQGRALPAIANPTRVRGRVPVEYDPRTQTLRVPLEHSTRGTTYVVSAPTPARGRDLSRAPAPPAALREFLTVPPAPAGVQALLDEAPPAPAFARLQFVRERFYEEVVAKGAGQPTDVTPARVEQLLQGTPGSPFEITAAEALLARWAGVPSRIGYGYYGGDTKGEVLSVRPRHGATWLEVYFHGSGWVPIVGTPPRAQSSLDSAERNRSVTVRPSENLTITALVPVRVRSIQLLYVVVQYWLARAVPALILLGLGVWLYPGVVKAARRRRRRRWAETRGVAERIHVAYASFRDAAHDLNVGHPALTPLEFLEKLEPDREHTELAWLVSRCLWGDLTRDRRPEDAELAEEMARSLTRRLRSTYPVSARAAAFASRRSLRDPYSDEVPNLWWPSRTRTPARSVRAGARRLARRTAPAAAIALLLAATACVQDVRLSSATERLPARLVPEAIGEHTFRREPGTERAFSQAGPDALVGAARVYSIHRGEDDVIGALQIGAFKRAVSAREREVRAGVLRAIGGGTLELRRIGRDMAYTQQLPEQQRYLWFPADGGYYQLFIARADVEDADDLFAAILAYQRGEDPRSTIARPNDPRRGSEG